jgi:hypothetical protein
MVADDLLVLRERLLPVAKGFVPDIEVDIHIDTKENEMVVKAYRYCSSERQEAFGMFRINTVSCDPESEIRSQMPVLLEKLVGR